MDKEKCSFVGWVKRFAEPTVDAENGGFRKASTHPTGNLPFPKRFRKRPS